MLKYRYCSGSETIVLALPYFIVMPSITQHHSDWSEAQESHFHLQEIQHNLKKSLLLFSFPAGANGCNNLNRFRKMLLFA